MAYDGRLVFDTALDNKGIENDLNNLGSKLKTSLLAVGAAVAAGVGAAVKAGMDFEASMSKVGAISGATAADMDVLSEKAKQMGRDTVFSASQAGEAFQYMAMAGWKTEDMLNGIDGVMNLAAASGENLGLVSDIVTDALTAFGLQAKDSAHFADVLAKASSNSNTNVAMMGATFKYVAPVAGAMKFSIEDTATAIGLMANAGIKGEQAGTTLRAIFTRLAKPPKEAADAIEALGISITEANGDFKSLGSIMVDLRKKFAKLTDEEKTQYAAMIGGQEAMSGLLSLVNAADDDFDKLTEAIADSNGAAKDMADTMMDNLKGQMTLLGSSLEGMGIAIYDGLEGPLKNAAKAAIESVNGITESLQSGELKDSLAKVGEMLGNLVEVLTDVVVTVLPAIINGLAWVADNLNIIIPILAALVAGIKVYQIATVAATKAQAAWNAVKLLDPTHLIVAAVAALAVGIGALCVTMGKHKNATEQKIEAEKKQIEKINEEIKAYADLKKAQEEKASADLVDVANAQRLWKELQTLVDGNGRVSEANKNRVNFILGELNSACGLELQLIDNTIQGYDGIAQSIDNLISKKKAKILLDAEEPIYKEALQKLRETEISQSKKAIEVTEQENKVKEAEKQLEVELAKNKEAGISQETAGTYAKRQAVSNEKKLLQEKQSAYDKDSHLLDDYHKDISTYENASMAIMQGNTEKAVELLQSKNKAYQTAASVAGESAEEQKKILSDQYAVSLQMLDEYRKKHEAGVEGYTTEGIAELEQYSAKCKTECETAGINITDGLIGGIDSKRSNLQTTLDTLFQSVPEWARKLLDMHSPSRVMRDEVGAMIVEGMAIGIRDNGGEVSEEFEKILDDLELKRDLAVIDESEYYRELERLRDNYLEKYTEKWWDVTKQLAQHDEQVRKEAMDKELNDLDWLLNTKEISEAEYYNRLAEYRDKYFEEDSEEWRQYTLKINSYRQNESDKARDKEFDQLKKQREYEQITEQQYYEKLAELRDQYFDEGSDEWEAYTDEIRKYNKSVVDELKNEIASVQGKLMGGRSLIQTVTIKDQEGKVIESFKRGSVIDSKDAERFRDLALQIKEMGLEGEAAALVMDTITEAMGSGGIEGVKNANETMQTLLDMPREELQALIDGWSAIEELYNEGSTALVSIDDTKQAVNESVDAVKGGLETVETEAENSRQRMEEKLKESLKKDMPELFAAGGEESGDAFWSAFFAQMQEMVAQAKSDLVAHMSANIPALATGGTGVTTANYSATYQFYGSGETTAQQLQAARNHATIERMRGL